MAGDLGGKCESGRWFQFGVGTGLDIGVACEYSAGEDEEQGEGEELAEASVEEAVVGGNNALHLWDVVVLDAPVSRYLFSASNV